MPTKPSEVGDISSDGSTSVGPSRSVAKYTSERLSLLRRLMFTPRSKLRTMAVSIS
ncbi:hypothetical protein D3C81_2314020 [compost metagenome]